MFALLVNIFGFGLVFTALPLYATRIVHLSTGRTGLGITIAGLIGLAATIPMGDLADRRGPRETARAITLVQAVAAICYLFIRNFAEFTAVVTLDTLALNAALAANGGALLRRVGGKDAAEFRVSTQAITNLGISLGVIGCGAAVQIGTSDAYRALFVVNAFTFVVAWAILGRLPHYDPLPMPATARRWEALADKPFLAYTALAGAMYIQYFVIIFLLPLWVVDHTHAPRWTVSLYVLINTVLVVLFQVRVGRNVKTLHQGGAAFRRAGVVFLFSCSVMGLATGIPGWAALLVLAAAVSLHTYGELWHSAGSYAFNFGMAPAHAQGQYQGLVGIGTGLGQAVSPVLLIGGVLALGRIGFVGLGAAFALLGLSAGAVASWGERTRPAAEQAADAANALAANQAQTR